MSSQLIGNIIAAFVTKNAKLLFIIFSVLAVIGSAILCFLTEPEKPDSAEKKLSGSVNNRLLKKDQNTSGDDETEDGDKEERTPVEELKATFALMTSGRMMMVFPIIIYSSFSMSVFGG